MLSGSRTVPITYTGIKYINQYFMTFFKECHAFQMLYLLNKFENHSIEKFKALERRFLIYSPTLLKAGNMAEG